MDPEQVRAMAAQLSTGATQIRDLASSIGAQIEGAAWTGPDRDQFVGEWQGHHMQALLAVSDSIDQASQKALANADQQEQTSAN
jgi:uncharacterized protein YukE